MIRDDANVGLMCWAAASAFTASRTESNPTIELFGNDSAVSRSDVSTATNTLSVSIPWTETGRCAASAGLPKLGCGGPLLLSSCGSGDPPAAVAAPLVAPLRKLIWSGVVWNVGDACDIYNVKYTRKTCKTYLFSSNPKQKLPICSPMLCQRVGGKRTYIRCLAC